MQDRRSDRVANSQHEYRQRDPDDEDRNEARRELQTAEPDQQPLWNVPQGEQRHTREWTTPATKPRDELRLKDAAEDPFFNERNDGEHDKGGELNQGQSAGKNVPFAEPEQRHERKRQATDHGDPEALAVKSKLRNVRRVSDGERSGERDVAERYAKVTRR